MNVVYSRHIKPLKEGQKRRWAIQYAKKTETVHFSRQVSNLDGSFPKKDPFLMALPTFYFSEGDYTLFQLESFFSSETFKNIASKFEACVIQKGDTRGYVDLEKLQTLIDSTYLTFNDYIKENKISPDIRAFVYEGLVESMGAKTTQPSCSLCGKVN